MRSERDPSPLRPADDRFDGPMSSLPVAKVSPKGADRWSRGHPWIYRNDVRSAPDQPGLCRVVDPRGKCIGTALHSPRSEIRLRLLTRDDSPIGAAWWREWLAACLAARAGIDATAYRVVHGEGDGLPSLVVVETMSVGRGPLALKGFHWPSALR